jgi:hypothetical protein
VYRSLLGERFDRLPAALREVHGDSGSVSLEGRCDVKRGTSLLSSILAVVAGLPPAGREIPLHVTLRRDTRGETWTRRFAGHAMRSRLRERGGLLVESLGPARFAFALDSDGDRIDWHLRSVHALGVPLPVRWFEGVQAREWAEDGVYRFEVRAAVALAGLLIHYRGWLRRE